MALTPATRLGNYEVLSAIGSGGMGEVYRARDSKLQRDVAIKIIPDALAGDPERLSRFAREAQALAALNHPNIAHIYGLEEHANVRAIVMELVEGQTLAQRIAAAPHGLPMDDAIAFARQMAEALDAAHARGVIHRDIKPSNVMIGGDDHVKVLDFGLARMADATSDVDAANSPTVAMASPTREGIILGTAAYMSPEQAKGRLADKRSDVWSFGCVLYEMLTGVSPFAAHNVAETLAAVLTREPNWSRVPADTPRAVRLCLERCLVRDRHERLGDMSTVRFLLSDTARLDAHPGDATVPSRGGRRLPWAVAPVLVGIAIAAGAWYWKPAPATPAGVTARFYVPLPEGTDPALGLRQAAVSPDGRTIVFATARQLFVRSLADNEPRPLVGGDEDAVHPVFSPDGQWIAYVRRGRPGLKKISVNGGTAELLVDLPGAASDIAWQGDTILLALNSSEAAGIYSVSERGGALKAIAPVDPKAVNVLQPEIVNGTHLLYTERRLVVPAALGGNNIVAQPLAGGEKKVVLKNASSGHVLPTGHLAFISGGAIRAIPFDARTLEVSGEPTTIVAGVGTGFSISPNGTLVHSSAGGATRLLTWVDRTGKELPMATAPGGYFDVRLSPDDTRIALSANGDIWIWTIANETLTKLTLTTEAVEYNPIWTTDGFVVFDTADATSRRVVKKAADGSGPTTEVAKAPGYPEILSRDGRHLVYHTQSNVGMLLSLDSPTTERPLVGGKAQAFNADLSPNEKWIAYQSDESGQNEIIVKPFPSLEGGWQVSTGGGAHPLWARNGGELFYIDRKGMLVAVPVQTDGQFAFAKGTPLFQAGQYYFNVARNYDVTKDGRRFVFTRTVSDGRARVPLTVVTNWFNEVRAKVGAK